DSYGLFCSYFCNFPTYDPENLQSLDETFESSTFEPSCGLPPNNSWWSGLGLGSCLELLQDTARSFFMPFLNPTMFRLMQWFYNSSNTKSLANVDCLVNEVILAEDFDCEDLHGFRATHEAQCMDKYPNNTNTPSILCTDNWNKTSVKVKLPAKKVQFTSELDAPEFEVPDLFYHKPLGLLRSAFDEVSAQMFHTKPFKLFWKQSPSVQPERIYGDLYTGDVMLVEHKSIQRHKSTTSTLENVITAIMVWSDSTHLANFGNAALWPIYMFIGNQSKYIHCKPASFSAHHLAYIPKVISLQILHFLLNRQLYFHSFQIGFKRSIDIYLERVQVLRLLPTADVTKHKDGPVTSIIE
ncbi:hypothetical protein M404DRAFT_133518, partial [Pisolithus tinctorius Marx 270]